MDVESVRLNCCDVGKNFRKYRLLNSVFSRRYCLLALYFTWATINLFNIFADTSPFSSNMNILYVLIVNRLIIQRMKVETYSQLIDVKDKNKLQILNRTKYNDEILHIHAHTHLKCYATTLPN